MSSSNEKQPRSISHLPSVNDYASVDKIKDMLMKSCGDSIFNLRHIDKDNSEEQDIDSELKRLAVLKSYDVLDIDTDQSFERITSLSARIFSVPICLVSIVDLGRQWFASNRGLGMVKETERNVAFCAHTILSTVDLLIVPDATKDIRFKSNPLVTGEPNIRFYAGVPLVAPEGYKLGTLCIIDTKPWPDGLTLMQKQNMLDMASMVMDTIVLRKKEREKNEKDRIRAIASTAHDMLTPLTSMQLNIGLLKDDKKLRKKLNDNQKELLENTNDCVDLLTKICYQTIDSFRGGLDSNVTSPLSSVRAVCMENIVVSEIAEKIMTVISSISKNKHLVMSVDDNVPRVINSNSLSIFRTSLSLLMSVSKLSTTSEIQFKISVEHLDGDNKEESGHDYILFEILYTGYESEVNERDLDLSSAMDQVTYIGGEIGFRARNTKEETEANANGEVVSKNVDEEKEPHYACDLNGNLIIKSNSHWFTIPLILPKEVETNKDLDETPASLPICEGSKTNNDKRSADHLSPKENEIAKKTCRNEIEKPSYIEHQFTFNDKAQSDITSNSSISGSEASICGAKISALPAFKCKRKRCALIIDDTKIIRKVFTRALERMGFIVKEAANGLKGLLEMKTTMFDVVFCDYLMPIMDGLDCVQQYRDWEKHHRSWFNQYIVGISAHANTKDIERGLSVGMNKHFSKPISLKQLKEIITSEEVEASTKMIDDLADEGKAKTFCLFSGDGEVSCDSSSNGDKTPNMCLVVEGLSEICTNIVRCVERRGWRVNIVKSGVEALNWMKMRNWDAIFMEDNLPRLSGTACIATFRTWEAQSRIARQRNVYLVSEKFNEKNVRPPPGCDGVLGTSFNQDDVFAVLSSGEKLMKAPAII
mmetsp:Transcript_20873/g.23674  ORF Transcript_20873/g.23674 Transcript_20873/m.23674 type:complete len:876 (-) Transcript_20873:83-2710(-)